MNPFSRILIVMGFVLIVAGLTWQLGSKLGLGKLPGDLSFETENVRFYFPLMSSVIISIVLSLVMFLFKVK